MRWIGSIFLIELLPRDMAASKSVEMQVIFSLQDDRDTDELLRRSSSEIRRVVGGYTLAIGKRYSCRGWSCHHSHLDLLVGLRRVHRLAGVPSVRSYSGYITSFPRPKRPSISDAQFLL